MEALIEFGKLLIPAALVLYAMYLVVRAQLYKELEQKRMEVRGRSIESVLPNRLHAYERMTLFLERINPQSLVMRLNTGKFSAAELHAMILREIRDEYNHNASQQVYMSDEVWELIKNAMEDLILLVNDAAKETPEDGSSLDLSKKIFEKILQREFDPVQHALVELKKEIRQTF
ncbi:MAG TPA: hypothetical protein PKC24_11415 [Cyclobacteriaceae bacterium]|mgnify:CR=1 FL=1|nr:hypothetical protein [Cyclobacteriaceae bacterium]